VSLFVRYGTHPRSDLRRGYSRPWGSDERHEGLSGYDVDFYGLEGALEKLIEYFAARGGWRSRSFVTVYRGREVGVGPDNESLFRPFEIVASVRAGFDPSLADLDRQVEDLARRLMARG